MKNVIELTAAELEMIESKRQMQAELDAKKEAAAEAEFTKAKTQAQSIVAKKIAEGKEQVAAANEFASALGSKYVKKVELNPIVEKAYKRDYNTHRADEESAVTFEGEYSEAVISRGEYRIRVIEHLVYSRYSYRGSSKGYKMYVSGPGIDYKTSQRGYKNAKKVNELIEGIIEAQEAKRQYELKQKSAIVTVVENFKKEYPTANVFAEQGSSYNPYNRRSPYTQFDQVTIALENGIIMKYRVYADCTLSMVGIEYPKMKATELISNLNTLKF